MKIAAAYIRVSTDDQTEYSPDAQLKAISTYCKQHDILLSKDHIYIDEGKSGRKAEKRPAFMRMIANAKTKPAPFEFILVHKFDRFARNREDSVVYKSLLNKECGVKVISITETVENDKISLIMESMLEAMAEYYSINLSEEVKKGMTEKATRGEPLSIAPFGYVIKNKEYIINKDEADIVRKIFSDFINGKPYLKIAREINAMGIRTHRGNQFENRTIEYIIRNPVYKGYIRWNPTQRTRRNFTHPDLMIVKGQHEPIISSETFEKAQIRVEEIKKIYKPYYRPQYNKSHWLVGLLTCATCDGSIINSGGYFVCNNNVKGKCPTRNSIRIEELADLVIHILQRDLEGNIDFEIIDIQNNKIQKQLDTIETELQQANIQLQRIKEAYIKGVDTIEEYQTNKAFIQKKIDDLNSRKKIKQTHNKESYQSLFKSQLNGVLDIVLSDVDNDKKGEALRTVVKNIRFDKASKTIDIYYILRLL